MPERIGRMQRRAGNANTIKQMHGDSTHKRAQNEERLSRERVWYIASREPSDTPPRIADTPPSHPKA